MDKFDLRKIEKELKSVAESSGTKASSTIQLILSNMELYNDLIDAYRRGETVKSYFMYQLNATIFKQLEKFGLVPPKVKEIKKTEESALADIIKAVNKR